jgi:RimJ/RimL family protein N-acetyltransferase
VSGDPVAGLVLRTPRLELRVTGTDDAAQLLEVARAGVHPPQQMPFAVAWTDAIGTPEGDSSFLEFHRRARATIGPQLWHLLFGVRTDGALIGVQELSAERFAASRAVSTGSWLGAVHQRLGYGTEMRTAVLHLAFAELGARRAVSGAIDGNEASLRVSQKLGYRVTGRSMVAPRGSDVGHTDLELTADAFRGAAAPPVSVRGCTEPLRRLLGA